MQQLEALLQSLGLAEFIPQLSEYRDEILREKAAELQATILGHAAEIQGIVDTHAQAIDAMNDQLAAVQADLAAKNAIIDSAKVGIKTAIADPELDADATVATIANIVAETEMPSIERRRAALAAEIAAKNAELAAL